MEHGMEQLSLHERKHKKKWGHAYHDLNQSAAAAAVPPPPSSISGYGQPMAPIATAPGFVPQHQPTIPNSNQYTNSYDQSQQFSQPHRVTSRDLNRRHAPKFGNGAGAMAPPVEDFAATQAPAYQATPGVPAQQAVPSIVKDRNEVLESLGDQPVFRTFENSVPPPACAEYEVVDQGIAGPRFARLTMYNVPVNEQLRQSTQLPLGMVVQPFAAGQDVHVVDFSQIDPPRCKRCRTYMNPSMMFVQGGAKFVCNMCQFPNVVSADYYQPTDHENKRIDWEQRPELAYGTYDIAVPKEFWKDEVEPVSLHHLFLIDVTADAVAKELPKLAVEAIRSTLYSEDSDYQVEHCKVGIVTFDKTLHFYNLGASSSSEEAADFQQRDPQQYVMSDLDEPFIPLEKGLFVDPIKCRDAIETLLDRLDVMFAETKVSEPAYGAALTAAYRALQHTGGKVTSILSTLPTWGPGSLFRRDETHKAEAHKDLLEASSQFYTKLGENYAHAGVGLDTFVFPNAYVDLANVCQVTRASGGHEYFYPRFVPQRDGKQFIADFVKSNAGEIATQCVLKVRCSNSLQVEHYYGNLFQANEESDPFFGSVGQNTTIGVLFKYDGKLDTKLDAHFQFSLLYTSTSGQRRVRVINTLAAVTEQYKGAMNFIDVDACMGIATRDALKKLGQVPLKEIRLGLTEKLAEVFASYRKIAGSNQPASQLFMPLSLRSLPIYFLALIKSRALRASTITSDSRLHSARIMNSMNVDELAVYLYPRIVGLHNLRPEDCTRQEITLDDGSVVQGRFVMPVNAEASVSAEEPGGAYLIFNGVSLILWIHKLVNPALLQDLFGEQCTDLSLLDPNMNELPVLDTDINIQARALIQYYAKQSHLRFLGIQLARQGFDGAELDYRAMQVEDRNMDTYNYTEYVWDIHRKVKALIENKNSKASNLIADTLNLAHGGM